MNAPSLTLDLAYLWTPFITLHIVGQVGTTILLLTYVLSKNIRRHCSLVNFWVTWLIYSISYSLLLYDRQQYSTPNTLCRVQAAMVDGCSGMVATAGFIAIVQIWLAIQRPPQSTFYSITPKESKINRLQLGLCLCAPYGIFLIFGIGSALVGENNFHLLNLMNGLYCSLNLDGFSRYSIPAYCSAIMIGLVGFEVAILVKYWKTRAETNKAFTVLERDISLSLILRMSIFTLGAVMVLSIGIVYMSNWPGPWTHIIRAALPLLASVVFGSHKDFLAVWTIFWNYRHFNAKEPFKPFQLSELPIPSAHPCRRQPPRLTVSASGSRTRFESAPPSAVERAVVVGEQKI